MEFKTSVTELIKKRTSWRSYGATPVEPEKKERLEAFFEDLAAPYWGNKARFMMADVGPAGQGLIKGTYGLIRGAGVFLVGAVKDGPRNLEDFGFQFEKIILFATDLGLGTCWMGVTFARGPLAAKLKLAADESIPAASPLGYTRERRALTDTVVRKAAGSAKRKPWDGLFYDGDWNVRLGQDAAGAYQIPLEMVRLGPSASNKQPWRIIRQGDAFSFFLQRSPGYNKVTSHTDLQRLDMGIAMCHFELTARELGLGGSWAETDPKISLPPKCEYVVSWLAG